MKCNNAKECSVLKTMPSQAQVVSLLVPKRKLCILEHFGRPDVFCSAQCILEVDQSHLL